MQYTRYHTNGITVAYIIGGIIWYRPSITQNNTTNMATSGEERGTLKFGAGVMDSDAGGFTADERERSAHLLKTPAREIPTTAGFGDDDDEYDSADDNALISDTQSKPPTTLSPVTSSTAPVTVPVGRPVSSQSSRTSPGRSARGTKQRATFTAKATHSQKSVEPARKEDVAKTRSRPATVSAPPTNDSESEAVSTRGSSSFSHHPRSGLAASHPAQSHKPHPQPAGLGDNFSLPQTPSEAVERYDESMEYIIEIFREMTNQNPQAVDVANMIIIFREQMRQWYVKDGQGDWSDAARFMTVFANTMHRVIHTCAQSAKARRQYRSSLVPPPTPSLLLSPQPDNVPDHRVIAKDGNTASTSSAQSHKRAGGGESSKDERMDGGVSETHFNADVHRQQPQSQPNAPAGLHFNSRVSSTEPSRGFIPPPYAQNLDDNSQENGVSCLVS